MQCPLNAGSRVWAYTRHSPGDDQDIGDQNRAVDLYCQENGLILERLFCDQYLSGSSTDDREQFQQMIQLAHGIPKDQLPQGLVIWSFSRFARDFDDAQFHKADLRRRGIAIISVFDEIPSDGKHGRLVEAVLDWHNEIFLDELRQSTKRGLADIARMGYAPGGFPPVGYLADTVQIGTKRDGSPRNVSRWIPDPDKAELVLKAFEMRGRGASYLEIHEETRLLRTKNSYGALLRNKTYLGVRKCGDLEIEGAHEPLVPHSIWRRAQETFHQRPQKGASWPTDAHPRREKSSFVLSGLARCGVCGSAMVGEHANSHQRWRCYVCGRKRRQGWNACESSMIGADQVEKAVIETVMGTVLSPDFVDDLVDEVNTYLSTDLASIDSQISEKNAQIAECRKAINNLLDLAERFGADTAGERLLQRERELDQLNRELASLEIRKEQSRLEVSQEVILSVLAENKEALTGDDIRARRTVLNRFVDRIELESGKGRLWLTFPLDVLDTRFYSVPPTGFEPVSQA